MIFSSPLHPVDALDVSKLHSDWPEFKQAFEIFLVAADADELIHERQKLAMLLNFMGRDARRIVTEWFPQLINFNSPSAREVTYAAVWNRLNAHCQEAVAPVVPVAPVADVPDREDPDYEKKLLCAFKRKRENLPETEDCVVDLVDMELFVKEDRDNQMIVNSYLAKGNPMVLNESSIYAYPIKTNTEVYRKYSQITTHLQLLGDPQKPSHWTIPLAEFLTPFVKIRKLMLFWVSVRAEDFRHKQTLRELSIVKSSVQKNMLVFGTPFLTELKHLEELTLHDVGFGGGIANIKLANLKSLSLKSTQVRSDIPLENLTELTLFDECNILEPNNYGMKMIALPGISLTLHSLTIPSYSSDMDYLKNFKALKQLTILKPVDPEYKTEIESMGLETVNVTYTNETPAED